MRSLVVQVTRDAIAGDLVASADGSVCGCSLCCRMHIRIRVLRGLGLWRMISFMILRFVPTGIEIIHWIIAGVTIQVFVPALFFGRIGAALNDQRTTINVEAGAEMPMPEDRHVG